MNTSHTTHRIPALLLLACLALSACGGGSGDVSATASPTVAAATPTPGAANTGTGSATLSWTPPTQNSDGSALVTLAGYRVYYGTSAGNLSQTIQLSNPGLTSYVVGNLASGTYYFAIAAYTSSGVEGALSNVGSKTV
jgi:hypothetical protein